jgi:hypothetical protein
MGTIVGSAVSTNPNPEVAVDQAVKEALDRLGGAKPTFGFIFASPKHPFQALMVAAREIAKTDLIGCTTSGEITSKGLLSGSVTATFVASDTTSHQIAMSTRLGADPTGTATALGRTFTEASEGARARGFTHSSTVLLADGLSPGVEPLVNEIRKHTRPHQQVIGAGAGDDGGTRETLVGANRRISRDSAVALHAFSSKPWGVGVEHGLIARTGKMTVTKATGNAVHEIDSRPAFDVYQAFARSRGEVLDEKNLTTFLVTHELGVYFLDDECKARSPRGVGPDGTLFCAAAVPQNSTVCILSGEPEPMIAAAKRAAEEARAALGGAAAAGVLMFGCACRGMILGSSYDREIDAVKSVFPGVPISGFLCYGEIARFKGRLDGYHNNTVVVVAIPA